MTCKSHYLGIILFGPITEELYRKANQIALDNTSVHVTIAGWWTNVKHYSNLLTVPLEERVLFTTFLEVPHESSTRTAILNGLMRSIVADCEYTACINVESEVTKDLVKKMGQVVGELGPREIGRMGQINPVWLGRRGNLFEVFSMREWDLEKIQMREFK